MIEQLKSEPSHNIKDNFPHFIRSLLDWKNPNQINAILKLLDFNQSMKESFSWLVRPIELNSLEAEELKEDYYRRIEFQNNFNTKKINEQEFYAKIRELINQIESDELESWFYLLNTIQIDPNNNFLIDVHEIDIKSYRNWKKIDPKLIKQIVNAAEIFIQNYIPNTHSILSTYKLTNMDIAGCKALYLLINEESINFNNLNNNIWKRWTSVILYFPSPNRVNENEIYMKIIRLSYEYAPDEFIEALIKIIDKENKVDKNIFVLNKIEHCWDDKIAESLTEKIKDKKLRPNCLGSILEKLLTNNIDEARIFAEKLLIKSSSSSHTENRLKSIISGSLLLLYSGNKSWQVIWPRINNDHKLCESIIETICKNLFYYNVNITNNLNEERLTDLFLLISKIYPRNEDPVNDKPHGVGTRERIGKLRDSLFFHLRDRGTKKSCEMLERIFNELPELDNFKWMLEEAQLLTRRNTWKPPQPKDIITIASDNDSIFVRNETELNDLLIETLNQMEDKLHGETPSVHYLWDEINTNKFRPKKERDLSDWIKMHFENSIKKKGIVVNREVEIHRGEKTDIYVNAISRSKNNGNFDTIRIILEVKGCWNEELYSAMETQLLNKYMKANQCQYGIYVIGWYYCNSWDDTDYKKKRNKQISLKDAQKKFENQAKVLSDNKKNLSSYILDLRLPD